MELHHKLRRDPSWHPSACNICGQLGHQAAACTIGTINWKRIFGEDAFKLRGPLYFSDIDKRLAKKRVDHDELERRAIEYAKGKAAELGMSYEDIQQTATQSVLDWEKGHTQQRLLAVSRAQQLSEQPHMQAQQQQQYSLQQQPQSVAQMQQPVQAIQPGVQQQAIPGQAAQAPSQQAQGAVQPTAATPSQQSAPGEGLPPNWAVAYDTQGRPYYWHTATQKVQWEKPTAETPAS